MADENGGVALAMVPLGPNPKLSPSKVASLTESVGDFVYWELGQFVI